MRPVAKYTSAKLVYIYQFCYFYCEINFCNLPCDVVVIEFLCIKSFRSMCKGHWGGDCPTLGMSVLQER